MAGVKEYFTGIIEDILNIFPVNETYFQDW